MRLLLLAALLFRLVPAPAVVPGEVHCGEHTTAGHAEGPHAAHGSTVHAGHEMAAHAEGAEAAEGVGHEECPHCPPADCEQHDHCPQPALLLAAVVPVGAAPAPFPARSAPAAAEQAESRVHSPPVRPPLQHLA